MTNERSVHYGLSVVNRLAKEASPYLQQHAHNPVDWYPWGSEAHERARRENKPILLSIGYSACHWCHVMEKESFENEAVAKLMNDHFVNVKVDREERPDLDQIYQLVVQLMGQGGGWPLTVFLTPEHKPFFGGTYFPPSDKYGRPGFPRVLTALATAYHEQKDEIAEQAEEISAAISKATSAEVNAPTWALGPDLLARATALLLRNVDDQHGGFGSRPKFPNTMALEVLLRRAVVEKDEACSRSVRHALDAMRAGGIWDHLGGGFHRYSTDERWLVPHFEKMLYDNALLLRLYVDGYRAFGEPRYADTAREIAAYVLREMTDAEGGFYASQDADSEGEEGKFFVWSEAEVKAALGADTEAAALALEAFGFEPGGNFEHTGLTVLSLPHPLDEIAARLHIEPEAARQKLERARTAMFRVREQRTKPFRDEKILASWSALMIAALADAGAALGEPRFLEAAERAFAFIEKRLLRAEGDTLRVLRLAKAGTVKELGFLDDVGFVACAALELYSATGTQRYVRIASKIVRGGLAHFADSSLAGGFFFTPDDGDRLLVRAKDPHDHAIPSGASMLALALLQLGTLCGEDDGPARRALETIAHAAVHHPFGMSQTVNVLHRLVAGSTDVVVVGARSDPRARALMEVAWAAPLLSRTIAWIDPNDPESIAAARSLAEGKLETGNPVAAFVCRGQTCSLPVTLPQALRDLLALPA